MKKILLFIILVFFLSGCFQKPASEKSRIDFRIGNRFIRLYIDNLGQATAQSGRLIEWDNKSFVIGRILDSTKFTIKAGGEFISRLKKIDKPVVEAGNGYSRTQIFFGDSLYYDINMYSSNF